MAGWPAIARSLSPSHRSIGQYWGFAKMTPTIFVFDLEATCGDEIRSDDMEILEIGGVMQTFEGVELGRFHSLVKPLMHPTLTAFCKDLLPHIDQESINAAASWSTVGASLASWLQQYQQPGSYTASWGAWDRKAIAREASRHGVSDPMAGMQHQNLKHAWAKQRRCKQVGFVKALEIAGLTLDGLRHHALYDAINTAKLLPFCPRPDPVAGG